MNSWTEVDFLSGNVHFIEEEMQEDMLLVEYDNNYILDMGWYGEEYAIYIIKDNEWRVPVAEYRTKDGEQIIELLVMAVERVDKESKQTKSYYGGLWKTDHYSL